eukprot:gene12006-14035_t
MVNSYEVPRDIGPGLLKFCLTHSDSPNLKESLTIERDPKDYEWLRQAFDDLEDDAKRMKKLNEVFADAASTETQLATALEKLEFFLEDLDNSGDYIKIGGIPLLIALMCDNASAEVRAKATNCLSILTQNEETIQNYFVSIGVLDRASKLLARETSPLCREKLLSLTSSVLGSEVNRHPKETLELVLRLCSSFLSPTIDIFLPEQPDQAIPITNTVSGMAKASFILGKIIQGGPAELKDLVREFGTIEALVSLVRAFNNSSTKSDTNTTIMVEKVESALLKLISNNAANKAECQQLQLSEQVSIRLASLLNETDDYQQEISVLKSLQSQLA